MSFVRERAHLSRRDQAPSSLRLVRHIMAGGIQFLMMNLHAKGVLAALGVRAHDSHTRDVTGGRTCSRR